MRDLGRKKARVSAQIALAALAGLQLGLSACATPSRLPAVPVQATLRADTGLGPVRYMVARDTASYAAEAGNLIRKEQAYLASIGHTGLLPQTNILAISGGGDNGAFGAGLLNGWTESGTRPTFKVVTGVSTGALSAPFAFLGSAYDPVLKEVYTTKSQRDIFKKRSFLTGLLGDAMADTDPLYALISRHVDRALLDAIAAEYAKGRVLLVATTNFDALEPVVWNMTAIAASRDPRAPELFRKVLLASASIPGAFPPVMIDVEVDGVRYSEMHVDGGAMAQVFLYPPSFNAPEFARSLGVKRAQGPRLFIIRNARLDPDWASVERRVLPIAARAIGSLTQTQGVGDLYRIYATARRDGIDYNLAFIPPTFNVEHREEFDTHYMRQLYETGRGMAAAGYPWQKSPPGFERTRDYADVP